MGICSNQINECLMCILPVWRASYELEGKRNRMCNRFYSHSWLHKRTTYSSIVFQTSTIFCWHFNETMQLGFSFRPVFALKFMMVAQVTAIALFVLISVFRCHMPSIKWACGAPQLVAFHCLADQHFPFVLLTRCWREVVFNNTRIHWNR